MKYLTADIREKGNIMGFRKRTRRLNADATLSKYDSNIICIQNAFTITLPADCEDGQEFVILSLTTNSVTIQPSTGDKISHTFALAQDGSNIGYGNITLPFTIASEFGEYYDSYTKARGVLLVYDKINSIWIANYMI